MIYSREIKLKDKKQKATYGYLEHLKCALGVSWKVSGREYGHPEQLMRGKRGPPCCHHTIPARMAHSQQIAFQLPIPSFLPSVLESLTSSPLPLSLVYKVNNCGRK